ncbi:hypothetical protein OEV98_03955 [Caldibacillus lycopersici]|uniref:AbiJ-NTD3 domain-containing protein n=1 Tax=Perspicuibacillus lycopersici TaxID=1325689 RepID=A0AAE3ITX2_9BACI|nr:hypothetical protein [Perspicuibacillus lycopersici]MCU9612719.1 hypothetical protein [Perspicuibacillus lycopersici]
MKRISEITKRDILDLFQNGIEIDEWFETKKVTYPYFGRMNELDFLKRLYDLKSMRSLDSRFQDAESDIWQHTVNNDDYPSCWVFEDERFQLKNGSDEKYLKFICEIFHPAVRFEKGYWKEFLAEVNILLQNDGYELYPAAKISSRDVYGWRIFQPEENSIFIPYSQRNLKAIKEKRISLSIKRNARNQIYQLLEKYNDIYQKTDETGFSYNVSISEEVFNDLRQFYTPKCYNDQKQYVETSSLQDFVYHSSPFCVMDTIEFFVKHSCSNEFEAQLNAILKLNDLDLKLDNGKIVSTFDNHIKKSTLVLIEEAGLKELLQEAIQYYDEGNLKIAVEKLWDAFERLKTYYSPTLDKKKSINRIICDMSNNKEPYKMMFEKEFHELTAIGNNFRIRHHETTKTDIEDNRHYDYFYKRCLSLISVAIQYLNIG